MINRVLRRVEYFRLLHRVGPLTSLTESLSGFDEQLVQCLAKLKPVHESYVREVSRADMAASLELGAFLCAVCQSRKPQRLLDLGSGFSSFVLRTYAKENPGIAVVSVDDDSRWLKKTASFLEESELNSSNLLTLNDFLESGKSQFDLILHDLNFVEIRINYVETVLDRLTPGGMAIFDDVHKRDYLHALLKKVSRRPGSCYSLKPVTLDQFGRYALAYVSPPA